MGTIGSGLILALVAAVPLGCSGTVEVSGGGGGAGGAAGSSTSHGGTGGTTTSTTSTTIATGGTGGTTTMTTSTTTTMPGAAASLAVHVLRMGDTLPNGTFSSTAWKQYGFNLDGKISTAQSVDLCKPSSGAKASAVYPDGDNGIDNSFGKNVLPIWTSLASDFSTQVNDAIAQGRFTVLFRIEGIAPGQTGTFPSQLYSGAMADGTLPLWQGADVWPIRSDCLVNGNPATPKTVYPAATVEIDAGGARRWQSVSLGDIDLRFSFEGFDMVFPVRRARMAMTLSDDNAHATSGMIGGIMDTEAYIAELAKTFGAFDPSLCPPSSTFESIAQQIRQASDILLDGSQDPNKTCNGISIGLGLDADAAGLGDVFEPPVVPDPCNP